MVYNGYGINEIRNIRANLIVLQSNLSQLYQYHTTQLFTPVVRDIWYDEWMMNEAEERSGKCEIYLEIYMNRNSNIFLYAVFKYNY